MALTKITQGVIKSNENYDTNNINSIGIITATGVTVTGDLNVAGVLTYDDVTNIDSVGVITARSGVHVGTEASGTLITGNSTGIGIGTDNPTNMLDIAGSTPTIELNDTDTGVIHRVNANSGVGQFYFDSDINNIGSDGSFVFRHGHLSGGSQVFSISSIGTLTLGPNSGTIRRSGDTDTYINFDGSDYIRFFTGNVERLEINNGGIDVTGHTELDNLNVSGIATVGALDVNGNAYPSAGPLSNRNLVINGDMRIDQRNNGSSVSPSTAAVTFVCDRFLFEQGGVPSNASTIQRVTDSPDDFFNSIKFTRGSASFNSSGWTAFNQRIEGLLLSQFAWGTSSAKPVTLSFWVKSTTTGTYSLNMTHYDGSNERWNVQEYNINSANTWEYKTLTFIGDSSYGFGSGGTSGWMRLYWHIGGDSGSAGATTFNTWGGAVAANRASTNQVNLYDVSGATFQITGVQLETGSVATPFEHRSYNDQLTRCQRYYTRYDHSSGGMGLNAPGYYNTSSIIFNRISFPTPMRTEGMALTYSNLTHFDLEPWDYSMSSLSIFKSAPNVVTLEGNPATTRSTGDVAFLTLDQTNAWIAFESEL